MVLEAQSLKVKETASVKICVIKVLTLCLWGEISLPEGVKGEHKIWIGCSLAAWVESWR